MKYIKKEVNVVDKHNASLRSTYLKRARQLVKNNRAEWISDDTICMKQHTQEAIILKESIFESPIVDLTDNGQRSIAPKDGIKDDDLLELAKRRLASKKNLVGQFWDFCLLIVVGLIIISIYDTDGKVMAVFMFLFFWGARLFVRAFNYAKPSFRNGISAYFRDSKERKLEAEYNRVKRMSNVHVRNELNK